MTYPPRLRPNSDGNFGRITAIDLVYRQGSVAPVRAGAAIASADASDGRRAGLQRLAGPQLQWPIDDLTGKPLWDDAAERGPRSSSPITYAASVAEQYSAVTTGGGGSFDGGGRMLAPEIENPTGGTTLVVFKLGAGGADRTRQRC